MPVQPNPTPQGNIQVVAGSEFTVSCGNAPDGLLGIIGITIWNADHSAVVTPRATDGIQEAVSGLYMVTLTAPDVPANYLIEWDFGTVPTLSPLDENLIVIPAPVPAVINPPSPYPGPDPTDLKVLVPWARRAMEGPYGPPVGKGALDDTSVYNMVADACSEMILFSGTLFGHKLIVKERDPTAGFPVAWQTDKVLEQWEGALIICQAALNYFFFLFRDMKTSEVTANEGSSYEYTLSANVLKGYMDGLRAQRDLALQGLRAHNPVLDRYASNIRVRDQATVAILEWWDTASAGISGSGLAGGQEAAVIPWTPGWTGP